LRKSGILFAMPFASVTVKAHVNRIIDLEISAEQNPEGDFSYQT
jgi:hypothetical protein